MSCRKNTCYVRQGRSEARRGFGGSDPNMRKESRAEEVNAAQSIISVIRKGSAWVILYKSPKRSWKPQYMINEQATNILLLPFSCNTPLLPSVNFLNFDPYSENSHYVWQSPGLHGWKWHFALSGSIARSIYSRRRTRQTHIGGARAYEQRWLPTKKDCRCHDWCNRGNYGN